MNKHVQEKIDSLMNTAKLFTNTYNQQVLLATTIALKCLDEAYKCSSLESARIDFWEEVMSELKPMVEEIG
jgi:hypothetical protein